MGGLNPPAYALVQKHSHPDKSVLHNCAPCKWVPDEYSPSKYVLDNCSRINGSWTIALPRIMSRANGARTIGFWTLKPGVVK